MQTPRLSRSHFAAATAALACAAALAGCGGSGSSSNKYSSTITVGNESSTLPAAVSTPTVGPLSEEPKVTPPKGPAPTKLETKDLIKGTGKEAKKGDEVTVNYVGVLFKTGKVFDASWNRKEPFSFTLGNHEVIKGWEQGVIGMRGDGRRELIIPPELAYGKEGSGSTIPPNSPLVFVVDLLKVSS